MYIYDLSLYIFDLRRVITFIPEHNQYVQITMGLG